MKLCQTCLVEQPLENFYLDKSKKDGARSKCKNCKKLGKQRKACLNCNAKLRLNQGILSKYCSKCRHKFGYCFLCQQENKKMKSGICIECFNNSDETCCFCCHQKCKQRISVDGVCQTCYNMLRKYSLSKEEYKQLRNIKTCQICDTPVVYSVGNSPDRAIVDHCHNTNKIRGIICYKCNIIEGMIRDFNHLTKFYNKYLEWTNQTRSDF